MVDKDGIMIIDKPAGWTSHDVVNFVRRRLGVKKVGHAGTLDPMATGVLVILVGKAVKLSAGISGQDKQYQAKLTLGKTTDSQDSSGKVISEKNWSGITADSVKNVFKKFTGELEQMPPMVSAIQLNGKRLYQLAREGKEVERKPRKIEIKELDILDINLPDILFNVTCSKGTYIRTLCHDIGEALGTGGHLSGLRRTRSGDFSIDDAVSIEELRAKECVVSLR